MITLVLPWPPSVNTYWRSPRTGKLAGRTLISERGRFYRRVVAQAVVGAGAPVGEKSGVECVIRPRARNNDQNAKLHAMFADIARQHAFFGQRRDAETVKRLLVDAFAWTKLAMGERIEGFGQSDYLPSLDGAGVVQLGLQTRRFSKALMGELIEYLYAWGADNDVRWSAPVEVPGWLRDGRAA